ncbi:caspase-2 [Elysia marginata]|uniref:Caspase-2 n=1 Tax=Elysia marginata TaxID=1093978 RepID=A0AAV4HVU4_9GAST|nr:caspase-2 [Elysia marginata]
MYVLTEGVYVCRGQTKRSISHMVYIADTAFCLSRADVVREGMADLFRDIREVNQLVSKKVSECNQKEMNAMKQMSEFKSSLRQPHLFLFPGIGISMNPPQ